MDKQKLDCWTREFEAHERVLAVAAPIAPRFGDALACHFYFESVPLVWFNETKTELAALHVPYTGNDSAALDASFALALRWMTLVRASTGASIAPGDTWGFPLKQVSETSGCGKPAGTLQVSERQLGFIATASLDEKSRVFWAQIREADSSESPFVRCLWLYKAIEYGVARGLRPEKLQGWVDKVVSAYKGAEPFDMLAKRAESACKGPGDYLENECRHAVAHVTREDRADPDDPQEHLRINEAVNALEALVQIAEDCGKVARPTVGID